MLGSDTPQHVIAHVGNAIICRGAGVAHLSLAASRAGQIVIKPGNALTVGLLTQPASLIVAIAGNQVSIEALLADVSKAVIHGAVDRALGAAVVPVGGAELLAQRVVIEGAAQCLTVGLGLAVDGPGRERGADVLALFNSAPSDINLVVDDGVVGLDLLGLVTRGVVAGTRYLR